MLKFFRKDGHSWRKRKDQRTIAEAHERLKVVGSTLILVLLSLFLLLSVTCLSYFLLPSNFFHHNFWLKGFLLN